MKKFALAALTLGLLSSPGAASWQLLPGRPFDGKSPLSNYKEPCWSAATSKCGWEQNRARAITNIRKGARTTRPR
jgi:hypothetical protein